MTEEREIYRTATNSPQNISQLTIEMLARTLARVFHRWQRIMPHYHFTEELLRRICQLALAIYEENDFDVENELPAEPDEDMRRDRHHGYNDDGIWEGEA